MRGEVTALEESLGGAPAGRIGRSAGYVRWNAGFWEVPDGDVVRGDLGSIDTATCRVETITIGCGVGRGHTTPSIRGLAGGIDIAVGGHQSARSGVGDAASSIRVKGNVVGALRIDTFDDIDLSGRRPVRAQHPAKSSISDQIQLSHYKMLTKQAKSHTRCLACERSHQ